jgi:hypothetical protein
MGAVALHLPVLQSLAGSLDLLPLRLQMWRVSGFSKSRVSQSCAAPSYSFAYQDALRAAIEFNERGEHEFEALRPDALRIGSPTEWVDEKNCCRAGIILGVDTAGARDRGGPVAPPSPCRHEDVAISRLPTPHELD